MQPWHLRFSSDGRHPLFPTETIRRAAVRKIVERAGDCLALFSIADDHAHAVPYCDRKRAGLLQRTIHMSLSCVSAVPIDPTYLKPVETRSHMNWLVEYLLGQVGHHGLAEHPAIYSGSCFQDLVGARDLVGLQLQLQRALPRFQLAQAWNAAKLPTRGVKPAGNDLIRAAGASSLCAAAAAACCTDPDLKGNRSHIVRARTVATSVGRGAGIPAGELAYALGITRRAVRRSAALPVDAGLVSAVRMRLAIELRVARGAEQQ